MMMNCNEKALDRGADCLSLIYRHFGKMLTPMEIRANQKCYGDVLRLMASHAKKEGFFSRRIKCRPHQLNSLSHPIIVGWRGNHYVVLESVDETGYIILDPLVGRRFLDPQAFQYYYSGKVLQILPQHMFEKVGLRKRLRSLIPVVNMLI